MKRDFQLILIIVSLFTLNVFGQNDVQKALDLQKEYENTGFINDSLFLVAEKIYLEVLTNDSSDYATHYKLATLYYNKAAHFDQLVYANMGKLSKKEIKKYDRQIDYLTDKARPHFVIYGSIFKEWKKAHMDLHRIWINDEQK